jgi:hypothetical protein
MGIFGRAGAAATGAGWRTKQFNNLFQSLFDIVFLSSRAPADARKEFD